MGALLRTAGAIFRLGRPLFLLGGVAPYALGAAMAFHQGRVIEPMVFAWGQVAVTSTQLMVHYANDYFDKAADELNRSPTRWSGGSRVLVRGELPPHVALILATALASLALVTIVTLRSTLAVGRVGPALLLSCFVLSWAYSAPPFRLHSRGLGEISAALVLAVLVPLSGFTLQGGHLSGAQGRALLPLGLQAFATVLALAFPDMDSDGRAGKRTLVVLVGLPRAAILYGAAIFLSFATMPRASIGARLVTLPLGIALAWAARDPRRARHLGLPTIVLFMTTCVAQICDLAGLTSRWACSL